MSESDVKCQQSPLEDYSREAYLTFYDKRFTNVTDLALIVTFTPDSVTRTEGDMNGKYSRMLPWFSSMNDQRGGLFCSQFSLNDLTIIVIYIYNFKY